MTTSNPIPTKQDQTLEPPERIWVNPTSLMDDLHREHARIFLERNFKNDIEYVRAADAGPRTDRSLISELIHIAAELARGEGFLPTCAEDMSPRLNRADILKTAERQDLQLKDWANRVKQVVDKLSAAATSSPTGAESGDAETLVKQWVSTLQEESHVTDEDAEDLVLRITAIAGAGFIPRDGATLVAGEQCSRKTAEQIVQRSLCAEPSHNCEESAAVHVRDLIESITSLSKPQYDALCEEHQNEFTVFHVGGCIKCWQESEAASTTHANVTAADTARLAAEEIADLSYNRHRDEKIAQYIAIISKHFATTPD